jgi:hypothetical protein
MENLKPLVIQSKTKEGRKAILKSSETVEFIISNCKQSLRTATVPMGAGDSVLYSLQLARNLCMSPDFQVPLLFIFCYFFIIQFICF